jgi:hypothetical protein
MKTLLTARIMVTPNILDKENLIFFLVTIIKPNSIKIRNTNILNAKEFKIYTENFETHSINHLIFSFFKKKIIFEKS